MTLHNCFHLLVSIIGFNYYLVLIFSFARRKTCTHWHLFYNHSFLGISVHVSDYIKHPFKVRSEFRRSHFLMVRGGAANEAIAWHGKACHQHWSLVHSWLMNRIRIFTVFKLPLFRQTTSLSYKSFKSTMSEQHSFPKEEEKILELWKELDAFQSSLKQSKGKPR